MERYGFRAFFVSIFLGPIGILLLAGSNPLRPRVEALQELADRQPVVIDANGVEVGTYIDGLQTPGVLFDFEGLPLFSLRVRPSALRGGSRVLYFESDDCSGAAFLPLPNDERVFPSEFYIEDGSGRTFVSTGETTTLLSLSVIDRAGVCDPAPRSDTLLQTVPVSEMEGRFTPPFQVVTRGDLNAGG